MPVRAYPTGRPHWQPRLSVPTMPTLALPQLQWHWQPETERNVLSPLQDSESDSEELPVEFDYAFKFKWVEGCFVFCFTPVHVLL